MFRLYGDYYWLLFVYQWILLAITVRLKRVFRSGVLL